MTAIYKEAPATLRESAALTDVFLDYTKGGSATALEFYAERQFAGDTAWYTGASETVGTPSGGAVDAYAGSGSAGAVPTSWTRVGFARSSTAALSGWAFVRFQLNGIGATASFSDFRYRVVTP